MADVTEETNEETTESQQQSGEDVSGLKSALEKERKRAREAEKKMKQYADFDPDEYRSLKEEAEKRAQSDAEKKGEWDKLRAQISEKHEKEKQQLNAQMQAMQQALETNLIDAEAVRAISASGGIPELLLPHVKAYAKTINEDGKFVVRVVDGDGNPRIGDSQGSPMTIKQLVDEMKQSEIFGRAFNGSGATGTGAQASRGSRGADTSKLSPQQKIALGFTNRGR